MEIIEVNMHILHSIQKNMNSLVIVVNQDFGLQEEVSTWTNDLESLKTIKGQIY